MKLPDAAAAGLKRRYLAHAAAERDLNTFLEGVVTALDIDPATVTGFDDSTSELLIAEPPDDRDDVT